LSLISKGMGKKRHSPKMQHEVFLSYSSKFAASDPLHVFSNVHKVQFHVN